MTKHSLAVLWMALLLTSVPFVFAAEKNKDDKVQVSAKELAQIKRQVRLMRAEAAELDERIAQITAQRDVVPKKEVIKSEK